MNTQTKTPEQQPMTLTEALQQLEKEASKDPESWVRLKRLFARIQVSPTSKQRRLVLKAIPPEQKRWDRLKGFRMAQRVIQRKALPIFCSMVPDLLGPNHQEEPLFLQVVAFLKRVEKPSDKTTVHKGRHRSLGKLFQKAEEACKKGKFSLASIIYQKLFEVCDCGLGLQLAEVLEHHRVKGLYLRSLYEATPPEQRPEKIIEALRYLEKIHTRLSLPLTTMIKILPVRPTGLDEFLSACVVLLKEASKPEEIRWLREAVELPKETSGIAMIARVEGTASDYINWLFLLRAQEKYSEVEEVAKEALELIPKEENSRVRVADFLFEAAMRCGDIELMRGAREEVFSSSPGLLTLLDLWEATPAQDRPLCMERVLAILRDVPTRLVPGFFGQALRPGRVADSLMLHALLLSDRVTEAVSFVANEAHDIKDEAEDKSALLLAFSLVVLSTQVTQKLPGNVSAFWTETVQSVSLYGYYEISQVQERFEKAYEQLFSSMAPKKEHELLSWSMEQAKKKILPVLQKRERKHYEMVTHLIVACVEVLQLHGQAAEANSFCLELQQRFSPCHAFKKMLSTALQQSRTEQQMGASRGRLAV